MEFLLTLQWASNRKSIQSVRTLLFSDVCIIKNKVSTNNLTSLQKVREIALRVLLRDCTSDSIDYSLIENIIIKYFESLKFPLNFRLLFIFVLFIFFFIFCCYQSQIRRKRNPQIQKKKHTHFSVTLEPCIDEDGYLPHIFKIIDECYVLKIGHCSTSGSCVCSGNFLGLIFFWVL